MASLHSLCGQSIEDTIKDDRIKEVARLYLFEGELEAWNKILTANPENVLFESARHEYAVSLLNLCQGQYRNAFKGLRLVLELYLQGIHLSVDRFACHEWLNNSRDTSWAAITDEENGVFGKRFCRAFFPELTDISWNYRSMAMELYRELSQCTHGNVSSIIAIPTGFKFDSSSFDTWSEKAETARLVLHFSLALRYLTSLPEIKRQDIDSVLLDELGHVHQLRTFLGGPTE